MVCPHCQSNDTAAIQGQNYCLNCGQLLPSGSSVAKAPLATSKPRSKPVHAIHHRSQKLAPKITVGTRDARRPSTLPKRRVMSDLRPIANRTVVAKASRSKPVPANTTPVPRVIPPVIYRQVAKTLPAKPRLSRALAAGLVQGWEGHGKRFGYSAGLILAILVGWPVAALLSHWATQFQLSGWSVRDWSLGEHGLQLPSPITSVNIWILGGFLAVIWLGLIVKLWSQAALVYGFNKQLDHRPLVERQWAKAAWNSLVGLAGLTLILVVVTLIVSSGLWLGATKLISSLNLGGEIYWLGVSLAGVIASTIGAWMIATIVFAGLAVIIGAYRVPASLSQGLKLASALSWRCLSALILSILLIALMVAGGLGLGTGAAWLLQHFGVQEIRWILVASIVIGLPVIYHHLVVTLIGFWLTLYRQLASGCPPAIRAKLLTGRGNGHARPASAILLAVVGLVVIGGLTYCAKSNLTQVNSWRHDILSRY